MNYDLKEYVRGSVHINTIDTYFSNLRRGLNGVYHHLSRGHFQRHLAELDFRYNTRKESDVIRAMLAVKQAEGRRLQYH